MLDRDNSFNYKSWIIALYYEPAGFLFHDCEDGQLGMTAAQLSFTSEQDGFTAICLQCHARMPIEYSQVLTAMWNLTEKTC